MSKENIQRELDIIKSMSFKNYVDKYEVAKVLNCCIHTVVRRLNKLRF